MLPAPRSLDEFTARGLILMVQRAEVVLAALSALGDGDVEVRLGEPAYRCPVPAAVVRDALIRRIDDVCAALSRRRNGMRL